MSRFLFKSIFKLPALAALGLSEAVSSAQADTFILQGVPTPEPAILIADASPVLPPVTGLSGSILNDPAFHRLVQMCEAMGIACGPDHAPDWSALQISDAEKRLNEMLADREAYAEALEEHFRSLPVPHIAPLPRLPHMLFGWNAPFGQHTLAPQIAPRFVPQATPQFGHLFPTHPLLTVPHGALSRPGIHDLSGFNHRLNTPGAVIPHSLFPGLGFRNHTILRPSFPWRSF